MEAVVHFSNEDENKLEEMIGISRNLKKINLSKADDDTFQTTTPLKMNSSQTK